MGEVIQVNYVRRKELKNGQLRLEERDDDVEIDLIMETEKISESADNFFDALMKIRIELEIKDIQLLCKGCCKNVYPSGMALAMGMGRKAYTLYMGKQAKTVDLVDIFEKCPLDDYASIEQQKQYFEQWIESLR